MNKKITFRLIMPLILGIGFAFVYQIWTEPSANQIRDFCSCLYVLENPLDQCQEETKIKSGKFQLQPELSLIKSKNIEVKFVSKELGCQEIVEPKYQAK